MSSRDATCIGRVRHVLGATVTVELDTALAGVTPLWRGRLQHIGQIGSLVRIPQGPVNLIATVTLVGIAELSGTLPPAETAQTGERWLQAQLLGEIDGLGRFQRGVSTYPGLDDSVHFATSADLDAVFPRPGPNHVQIGSLSSSPDVSVALDAARLVTRHSAIVGSTGSGKTSAVARVLQSFLDGGWHSANIVVIDPHGEYGSAVTANAAVRSVLVGGPGAQLVVPFWALPCAELFRALCPSDSQTIFKRFAELVASERRAFAASVPWLGTVQPSAINSDTAIPFDLRSLWFQLDTDNRATFEKAGGAGAQKVITPGDATTLRPTMFEAHSPTNTAPFKGPSHGQLGNVPDLIRLKLLDPRYKFFLDPPASVTTDPLPAIVGEWLGETKPVSILDFSGVPSEVADLAIGGVLQLIFDVAIHSSGGGIGRSRPVMIVLEEAHRYLGEGASARLAREAVNRIAREGRKYGVGLMLVTQRPSELPDTALSQCGTIIALRLTNGADQGRVKAALPDSVSGLADALPALRTGEAIITGEAMSLPARASLSRPDPPPNAHDPTLSSWLAPAQANDVASAIAALRRL